MLVHVLLPLTGVYTTTAARHHSHCRHFIWFLFVHLFFVVARVVDNTLLLMFMQADFRASPRMRVGLGMQAVIFPERSPDQCIKQPQAVNCWFLFVCLFCFVSILDNFKTFLAAPCVEIRRPVYSLYPPQHQPPPQRFHERWMREREAIALQRCW